MTSAHWAACESINGLCHGVVTQDFYSGTIFPTNRKGILMKSTFKASMTLTMGAAHAVAPGDDAVASITALTRGRGAEATIDLVGSDETSALGAAVTRSTGHLTIVGIAGGGLPVSFFSPAYEVSVASTYWGTLPELVEVIELARSGHIAAHIERRPLDAAAEAYSALRAGDVEGRVVVVPGG